MTRLRYNGLTTTLAAALAAGDTSVTFADVLTHSGGVGVPTIGSGDYIPLSLLNATGRLAEIVYLTGYAAGASTGTITRAQELTSAVAHVTGARVTHGPNVTDLVGLESGRVSGTGSPEGVVTAPVGTEYVDRAATNGAVKWVKATGTGNTGWQVLYGDTGVRDITDALPPGLFASGNFRVRRINAQVFWLFNDLVVASSLPAAPYNVAIPTGFTMGGTTYPGVVFGFVGPMRIDLSFSQAGSIQLQDLSPGNRFRDVMIVAPGDNWPTALPGTPA